jgi:hypothetical protein
MRMSTAARNCLIALEVMLFLWPLSAYSRVWYVRSDGTGDAPTIQAAIDSSAAGDTITLAKGLFVVQASIGCNSKNNIVINSVAGFDSTSLGLNSGSVMVGGCSGVSIDGISFRDSKGIALSLWGSSQITISNCGFFNNGHFYGNSAILFEWCDSIDVHNSNISGNHAGIDYYELNSNILNYSNTCLANTIIAIHLNDVTNCSITHSIISGSSYGILGFGINLSIECNDVFNNGENYAILDFPDPTGIAGNISIDPQFCSIDPVAYNNYHLQSDSPCAPGNHPNGYACGLIGCEPVGCATTGTERTNWSKVKQLFK